VIPEDCGQNAHMYYLLLRDLSDRTRFIDGIKAQNVNCVFHYVPLHSSPYGRKVGRVSGSLSTSEDLADRLVRLPLWLGLNDDQDRVIERCLLR
jgi:dTDP-4-amino-4,6-dideoxygalactose transaminase